MVTFAGDWPFGSGSVAYFGCGWRTETVMFVDVDEFTPCCLFWRSLHNIEGHGNGEDVPSRQFNPRDLGYFGCRSQEAGWQHSSHLSQSPHPPGT